MIDGNELRNIKASIYTRKPFFSFVRKVIIVGSAINKLLESIVSKGTICFHLYAFS